jgi:hypothetical protein
MHTRKMTKQGMFSGNSDTVESKTLRFPYLKGVCPHDCFHPAHGGVEDAHQEDDQAGDVHLEPCYLRKMSKVNNKKNVYIFLKLLTRTKLLFLGPHR